MKYLDLAWKSIYWSAIWSPGLCILSTFISPDTMVGFVLAVFVSPIFGIPTALIKHQENRNIKFSQTKTL